MHRSSRRALACLFFLVLTALLVHCVQTSEGRIDSIYAWKAEPSEQNLRKIRALIDHPDRDVRATALNALVSLGVPDSGGLALAGLQDTDPLVRRVAAKLLGDVGDPANVHVLVQRLDEDQDKWVRKDAAESLEQLGGEEAVQGLLVGLEDPIKEVRLSSVRAVRKLDPAAGKTVLARLVLEDPVWEIRVQAARALGATGDPEVRPILEAALGDANEYVRSAAEHALRVHQAILAGEGPS